MLDASTALLDDCPAYLLHVQPPIGFSPSTLSPRTTQAEFESDPHAVAKGVATLGNWAWEDGSVVGYGADPQILASGTNYVLARAGMTTSLLPDSVRDQFNDVAFATCFGWISDTPGVPTGSSGDLALTGGLGLGSEEPAEASTDEPFQGNLPDEETAFEAMLSQVRVEYEQLAQAEWFKKVYLGKSIGDVIREL